MKSSLLTKSVLLACFMSLCTILCTAGCSSVGKWIQGEAPPPKILAKKELRFSDAPELGAPNVKKFKRMTKNRFEEEAQLHPQAGSLWTSEGQTSYLFSQNKSRREGDLLNIKLEGPAQKQVDTKVVVIKRLLKRLEAPPPEALSARAPAEAKEQAKNSEIKAGVPAGGAVGAKVSEVPASEDEGPVQIDLVQTRVVERVQDGNYRVKGSQPFMIGKREYKVIITGLVRPEDFDDNGISSNKLLDPQFDVVSIRRSGLQ